ncbi:MAG: hypothetical protein JL55_34580 [Pseudomonas sp. BICA1-14]|nr:MAG: hypothetical protein VR76_15055 [Pseudomonas sp. BRH_c35]KJS68935.1 MAG: hypothetical protein JL55_34580 [[Pseudomonas] sp. BICA1-14]
MPGQRFQLGQTDFIYGAEAIRIIWTPESHLPICFVMTWPIEGAICLQSESMIASSNLCYSCQNASTGANPAVSPRNSLGQDAIQYRAFLMNNVGDHGRENVLILGIEECIRVSSSYCFKRVRFSVGDRG